MRLILSVCLALTLGAEVFAGGRVALLVAPSRVRVAEVRAPARLIVTPTNAIFSPRFERVTAPRASVIAPGDCSPPAIVLRR